MYGASSSSSTHNAFLEVFVPSLIHYWKPVIPEYSVPLADRGAGMTVQGSRIGRPGHQARMLLLCILPSTCNDFIVICSQEIPSTDSAEVVT